MDMSVYLTQKAAGIVTLVKLGAATVGVLSPKFDANTGQQLPASVDQFNVQGLDDAIAKQQSLLDQMTQLRADVVAALAK